MQYETNGPGSVELILSNDEVANYENGLPIQSAPHLGALSMQFTVQMSEIYAMPVAKVSARGEVNVFIPPDAGFPVTVDRAAISADGNGRDEVTVTYFFGLDGEIIVSDGED
jgi:hypothetical protein